MPFAHFICVRRLHHVCSWTNPNCHWNVLRDAGRMKTAEMSLSLGLIAVFIVRVVGGGVAAHAEASVLPPASPSPSVSVAITHPPDGGVVAGPDVVVRLAINAFPPPADMISAETPPPPNASLLVVRRRLCRRPRRCWAAVGYYRSRALARERRRGIDPPARHGCATTRRLRSIFFSSPTAARVAPGMPLHRQRGGRLPRRRRARPFAPLAYTFGAQAATRAVRCFRVV